MATTWSVFLHVILSSLCVYIICSLRHEKSMDPLMWGAAVPRVAVGNSFSHPSPRPTHPPAVVKSNRTQKHVRLVRWVCGRRPWTRRPRLLKMNRDSGESTASYCCYISRNRSPKCVIIVSQGVPESVPGQIYYSNKKNVFFSIIY